jgi:hypothetical protein
MVILLVGDATDENSFEIAKRQILNKDANSLSRMMINYDKESTKPSVIAKLE